MSGYIRNRAKQQGSVKAKEHVADYKEFLLSPLK